MLDENTAHFERDWVRHIWLDFQQMSVFERDPIIVVSGRGMRVTTDDGREFIDAIGGAMVSVLGYGDGDIRQAMHASVDRLDFWPVLHSTTPACNQAVPQARRNSPR